jgi:hypothetical protein
MMLHTDYECKSFRYTPLLLERDELPELQSKEVKREIMGQTGRSYARCRDPGSLSAMTRPNKTRQM